MFSSNELRYAIMGRMEDVVKRWGFAYGYVRYKML